MQQKAKSPKVKVKSALRLLNMLQDNKELDL